MKKMIYVTVEEEFNPRSGNPEQSWDDYMGDDLEAARVTARGEYNHFTYWERKDHRLYIEGYEVETEFEDDEDDFNEKLDEARLGNPCFYEEFTPEAEEEEEPEEEEEEE